MRVQWFTNIPLPDACKAASIHVSPKGGWMPSLADALMETGNVELAVVSSVEGTKRADYLVNGVRYFILPMRSADESQRPPTQETLSEWNRVIEAFQPDIIHVHGTERYYGFLASMARISIPAVISIQGFTGECYRHYDGGISFSELLVAHSWRDLIRWDGHFQQRRRFKALSRMEAAIVAGARNFIGRTRWDRAHVLAMNPQARYFHGDELLRAAFHRVERLESRVVPHSIFASTASYPLKGFHWLLKAVAILKRRFPNITLRVADAFFIDSWRVAGYGNYLFRLIRELGLENHVTSVGLLSAEEMAGELAKAHVFVAPSMVENLCNSLAEAMLVGTPSVVSFAGGMTTTVKDGETALCFPPGDHAVMAECIRMLFEDDVLAKRLSVSAQAIARVRHDKLRVTNDVLAIYSDCIANNVYL